DQQDQAVLSAYQALLNNDLQAYSLESNKDESVTPTISGSYTDIEEGIYTFRTYSSGSGPVFQVSGLESVGARTIDFESPITIGNSGLYATFPEVDSLSDLLNRRWEVSIPNKRSSTYTSFSNAYINAQRARDTAISQSEVTLNDVKDQERLVSNKKLVVDQRNKDLEKTILRAPFSGEVTSFDLSSGELVSVSTIVASIKNLSRLEVEFYFSEREAPFISRGSSIVINGLPSGEINFVGSSLGQNNLKLRATALVIANRTSDFIEGMDVTLSVIPNIDSSSYSSVEGLVTLPLTAIQILGNDPHVAYINEQGTVSFIPVEIGLLLGDKIEIVTGLDGVDTVILDARGLQENDSVEVSINI
ncbi:MAG: RND family efflux transporter MFP subunit, partial [Candidatus Paceibacteria bacterium]